MLVCFCGERYVFGKGWGVMLAAIDQLGETMTAKNVNIKSGEGCAAAVLRGAGPQQSTSRVLLWPWVVPNRAQCHVNDTIRLPTICFLNS